MEAFEDYRKMSKEKLFEYIKHLETHIDILEDNIQDLTDDLAVYMCDYTGLEKYQEGSWINVESFIERLKLDNLYDSKMEKFMEDYMRFYNEL